MFQTLRKKIILTTVKQLMKLKKGGTGSFLMITMSQALYSSEYILKRQCDLEWCARHAPQLDRHSYMRAWTRLILLLHYQQYSWCFYLLNKCQPFQPEQQVFFTALPVRQDIHHRGRLKNLHMQTPRGIYHNVAVLHLRAAVCKVTYSPLKGSVGRV